MKIDRNKNEIHVTVDDYQVVTVLAIIAVIGLWWWQAAMAIFIVGVLAVLIYKGIGGSVSADLDGE